MALGAIFDLDGTLVTFRFDLRTARKEVIRELADRGYDMSAQDSSGPTQRLLDAAKAQTPSGDEPRFACARRAAFEILDRYEVAGVSSTEPFPETRETLEELSRSGVRMAVLTNSGRKAASAELELAGISGYFEFVLTRDDTVVMKPAPEGVVLAASRLCLPRDSTYYIGDSPYDVQAAKAAKVKVISVATGSYPAARLRDEGADYAVASLADLKPLFAGLRSQGGAGGRVGAD
ncbi:MAG: HAD-IA family hydrolase [Nitrososphaerota archaeon]|jgi:HAD superfamily hydrolase (TIGR01549 family)|nr:HAD-IA family hydrolase [Nitrososphaerota archaeon]MDG6942013.1 HAD-IA family hydrolase [Nitrososphaerota archaeon]MDG6942478.1 HAD-IA family hydrolase [Nitrososphaerota archaeon]MDG6948265.1 HAD-IA family hydrolase [Nitrososphaerota archaeon]